MHNASGADTGAGPRRPTSRLDPMTSSVPRRSQTRRRRLRRVLDVAVTGLARLLQHVFFRQIEVAGIERIPRDKPLVFASNHMSTFACDVSFWSMSRAS